jgi:FkbM family methyltransferase
MRAIARRAIERLLRHFEYRLTDVNAQPAGLERVCQQLTLRGFQPRTVIDVGVGTGTPWLYNSFPDAKFVLFEALDSFRSDIERIMAGRSSDIHFCALGEEPGRMAVQVNSEHPTSSSMARFHKAYRDVSTPFGLRPSFIDREVEVRMLDEFLPLEGPALLKLDVEGFEYAVLRGATKALEDVEVIISEISVVRRTEMEPTFAGYLTLLESLGFSLINIAEIAPMIRGGPIAYLDAVFVRSNSPMRYR